MHGPDHAATIPGHTAATVRLAAPLAVAQLAQMAMNVTDTVLLGRLGGEALAAGGLGGSVFITVMVVLQGVLAAVSVLSAQALGAGREGDLPRLYWTGMLLTVLLMVPAFVLFSLAEPLLLLAGEPPELARATGGYLGVLRWAVPGDLLGIGLIRAFLPVIGGGILFLWVTVGAAVANAVLCYGLIHGAWGLPAMGLHGAALATTLALTGAAVVLLLVLHAAPAWRRFVRWPRAALAGGAASIRTMLRLGIPVSATFAVESGLFLAVALLIGRLGPAALAAQQVAITTISVSFMIPLGLAQAANIRVGHHVGAGDGWGARRAGLVAIGLGALAELVGALVIVLAPGWVVGLYLDPADTEAFSIAVGLLGVAALFQVADGVQSVAGGALRGLGDTQVPFALAAMGYWGVGFPAAWWLTTRGGLGAAGAWWGLAAGLTVVAVLLTARFVRRSRPDRPVVPLGATRTPARPTRA